MKNLILLIISIYSIQAYTQTLTVGNTKLVAMELGAKHYIFDYRPKMKIRNAEPLGEPALDPVDCEKISESLSSINRLIQSCKAEGTEMNCQRADRYIQRLANSWSPRLGSSTQHWNIEPSGDDNLVDSKEVATVLGTTPDNIVNMQRDPIAANAIIKKLTVFSDSKSMTKLVSGITELDQKIGLDPMEIGFFTNNRILACDLANGDARVAITYDNNIAHTESVKKTTKESGAKVYKSLLTFKINKNDSKLIQAAYFGNKIGRELNEAKDLSIKEVFTKLINVRGRDLELKEFSNVSNMIEQVFPDKNFYKEFQFSVTTEVE